MTILSTCAHSELTLLFSVGCFFNASIFALTAESSKLE
jgi:hypothetical protein